MWKEHQFVGVREEGVFEEDGATTKLGRAWKYHIWGSNLRSTAKVDEEDLSRNYCKIAPLPYEEKTPNLN